MLEELSGVCNEQTFAPGDVLRKKGQHYRNLYLITRGECSVELKPGKDRSKTLTCGRGQPIGEIGFLRGTPASADVTARDTVHALVIDDETLEQLEARHPDLVVRLLQKLGAIAEDRTSYDLTLPDSKNFDDKQTNVEVLLCRNSEMLLEAQKLRYEVYCTELGRQSPSADHDKKIIADAMDESGLCFIAVKDGETVGTIRSNFAKDGSLGMLERLYGMKKSPHHPEYTAITTKFIVKRALRGSPTAMQLVAHLTQYGMRQGMKECYIDCIPKLIHYYRAMGFRPAEEIFLHPENGPSLPMQLDLLKYGNELVGEVGIRRMVKFYLKAKALKFAESFAGL